MLTHSETTAAIAAALASAQGLMDNAAKGRENPAFRSKYADLASVREAVCGPLSAAGIAVLQAPRVDEHGVSVETRLLHKSGEWLACSIACSPKDYSAQSIGSAVTYLRRYGLMALAGIAPEDDDGNAAGIGAPPPRRPNRQPHAPPGEGHDAEFTDTDRRAFMAALSERGVKYDDLKAFCQSVGMGKPSELGHGGRVKIIERLDHPDGRARFEAFLASRVDASPEAT